MFEDGELGSPRIICDVISAAVLRGSSPLSVPVSFLAIEEVEPLFQKLCANLGRFDFAEVKLGSFVSYLARVRDEARDKSVFLYIDPFTVEGLNWSAMDEVFAMVSRMRSVELLLNFNASSFARRGLAALKLSEHPSKIEDEDLEAIDANDDQPASITRLNDVVGGDWWQDILRVESTFSEKVNEFSRRLVSMLSRRFKEVCSHPVKAEPHHTVPKYFLIFGSRHPHALRLMNDEMAKSRATLAELALPPEPTLFELRPTELIPDDSALSSEILVESELPIKRGELILRIIRKHFCEFTNSRIRGEIEALLRCGQLRSETGKQRINDEVLVWVTESTGK